MNKGKELTLFIPHLGPGGAQKVFIDLANYLVSRDYRVTMLVLAKGGVREKDLNPDVSYRALGTSRMLFAIPFLVRYLKKHPVPVILSTLDYANVTLLLAKKLAGVKTKIVIRIAIHISSNVKNNRNFNLLFARFLTPYLFPKADAIVAVSGDIVTDLNSICKINQEKIHVIYNPVAKTAIRQKAQKEVADDWFDTNNRVVMSAGRLWHQKDFATLITGFAKAGLPPDVKLAIFGDGPLKNKLQQLIISLRMTEQIRLMGFAENPYKYMAKSEIYVMSSLYEGMPNSLIQAMFCGCKIISTDCPTGPREVLKDGAYGKLFEPGDSDQLAVLLNEVLANPAEEIPNEWLLQFEESTILPKYEKLLNGTVPL